FDKTGTLTAGTPRVAGVEAFGQVPAETVLRLAASLDQVSSHVFADAIVAAARRRALELDFPRDVHEYPGRGITGTVSGTHVGVGQARWLAAGADLPLPVETMRRRASMEGFSTAFVTVAGHFVGAIVMDDPIRPESAASLEALRRVGVSRI